MPLRHSNTSLLRVNMTIPSEEELRVEANKDATVSSYRVSVLYGDTGKRKTTTACRMVQSRGLLLSSDDSWKVLLNERHADLFERIKIVEIESISQLKYIDYDGYDTIILDTVSGLVDRFLDLLYDEAGWAGKNLRDKISTRNKELQELNIEILAAMDYRVTRDVIRPHFRRLFNLPAHIIFTSQHKVPMKGLSPDETIRPDVPNATFKLIAERADLIANIRPENSRFIVDLTEQSKSYLGKSRIEGLENKMNSDEFVKKYKEIVFK